MRSATQLRNAEIATIKIGAKSLDMDDDTYRFMLERITGKRSAADLDWQQRKAVIDYLKSRGAKITKGSSKGKPANFSADPYYAKIEALLADMELSWAYVEAIAERITGGKAGGVKKLAWVKEQKHFTGIVAALEYEKKKRLKPLLDALGVELHSRGLGPRWCVETMHTDGFPIPPSVKASGVKWNESIAIVRALQEQLQ